MNRDDLKGRSSPAGPMPGRHERDGAPQTPPPIVFLFSGQGSQYYRMGMDLHASDPHFRRHFDALEAMARDISGHSVRALIDDAQRKPTDPFTDVPTSSLAIYVVERALTRCLADHGIVPALCIGSSLGLYAALTAAGCLAEEDALALVFAQGQAFMEECEPGGMISILGEPALHLRVPELREVSDLAGVNFDEAFVVSARTADLPALYAVLKAMKLAHQELPVARPFHSRWIEPARDRLHALGAPLCGRRPTIPVACCTKRGFVERLEVSSLWHAARDPLMFRDTVHRIEASGPCRYVDVGPSGTMATLLKYALPPGSASSGHVVLSPFGQGAKRLANLRTALQGAERVGVPAASAREVS